MSLLGRTGRDDMDPHPNVSILPFQEVIHFTAICPKCKAATLIGMPISISAFSQMAHLYGLHCDKCGHVVIFEGSHGNFPSISELQSYVKKESS